MSCNGTLSYYNEEKKAFFTVYIHHIENNDSLEIDSLKLLNKYYLRVEDVMRLVDNGSLSHFGKNEIIHGDDNFETKITKSIKELNELTSSWGSCNYVYFFGNWFNSPNDVYNLYYNKGAPENCFEAHSEYDIVIYTSEFFISKENPYKNSLIQNTNVSKVVILSCEDEVVCVLCVARYDIIASSVANQINNIYEKVLEMFPTAKNALWYDFDKVSQDMFVEYLLSEVSFDENNSPRWGANIALKNISKKHKINKRILEKIIN